MGSIIFAAMKGLLFVRGIVIVWMVILGQKLQAQDTLPKFSVIDRGGGRVVVSWINPFSTMVQVAVQRSYDSLKRFSTIYSAESPELPQNGFTDKVYPGIKVYYRIFYSLEGGAYFFTKAKQPAFDITAGIEIDLKRDRVTESIKNRIEEPDQAFTVKLGDSVIAMLFDGAYLRFKDSIMSRTKDTLTLQGTDIIVIKRYVLPYVFRTSIYVYPDRDGYIAINLPDALTRKYELIITEEDDTPVLELRQIKAAYLTLDKADFYHGGWYKFQLLEDGQVKERNKFFLAKDY